MNPLLFIFPLLAGLALSLSAKASTSTDSVSESELRTLFSRATHTAIQRSPQVRGAQFSAEAAREDVNNAKGARLPQVDVTTDSRSWQFGDGDRNASRDNVPAFGVTVSTTLYDFGQTRHTIDSREHSVNAADHQLAAQYEDLAWQVSSEMIELTKQRLIIEMSQQYVARMQELVTMLSGIVEQDPGRRSELTQARGRFLQAQSALDNATARLRDSEIKLQRLTGGVKVALPPARRWQLKPGELTRLLQQLHAHPTLAQARSRAQAALAEAEALKSSNLPKVNWVISKSTAKDYYGRREAWQTGVNVSWGVFRGGSSQAAERAAVQRAWAQSEEAENQLDDLQQRVKTADQDAHSMLQRAGLYHSLTFESDRIRKDFFDQWYHLGKRTLLDVLSAESDYYNNRVAEVTNRYDGYSAILRGYAGAGELTHWLNPSS
ncbi:channel protein TolC [Jejubacter calystegiae]|uniref:Channel protein TolC n=1 Tax=Jejubacter calystegiae TaxID=2579935 RepID=A0A4P8YJR7_9ENTR|nr:TolC family protein [Jejubacter calystegiae]QCT20995.1 channel protein TolC [Jejubacter calystegiae]